jgi:NADP-dependent 3-hydroxy acid dehydrogenase YdfG
MSNFSLRNRVAVITGASAGIGRATALALARDGAAAVVMARREEKLESLLAEIRAAGGTAMAVPGDAAKESDIVTLLKRAQEFSHGLGNGGKIDIVIVNAGRGLAGGLLTSDEKQWREMYDINVLGAAMLMRRAGEILSAQGSGDIVALGSVSGHNISPFSGFYGGSKFAVAGMVEAFRREVCGRGVRVTLVLPGVVESEFQGVAGYTPENFFKGVAKFGALLKPEDVARAIAFVVSQPANVHINELVIRPTGQDYP